MESIASIRAALESLQSHNIGYQHRTIPQRPHRLQKVLVANRGEIAKRFFHSLREEGIPSVAIVTNPDIGQSWYAMADEAIFIGNNTNYTNIPVVIAAALLVKANAIYPGYGFLSENHSFVDAIQKTSEEFGQAIIFMGPSAEIMRRVGDKLDARALAQHHGIPLFKGTEAIKDIAEAESAAHKIGYPVIVKLNSGGGGKGMQPVFEAAELPAAIESCQRIGRQIYGDDTFYLERFIVKPVHMEVQLFNGTAIGIRKCAVQRRNQKIIEESGDIFLSPQMNLAILAAAENMARISGYHEGAGAGTVEFLYDQEADALGFLEMNTRLQVEHPVTDQSLGIDLAKWQILQFDGRTEKIPFDHVLRQRFTEKSHAIEARIYAEDTENNYQPAPGTILELDLPTFNGIRCDFGFNKGDSILPDYDPMIGKIIAKGVNRAEALVRLERALSEFYVKGVTTNTQQLLNIVRSPQFHDIDYTNRLLGDNPALAQDNQPYENAEQAAVFGAITLNLRKNSELAKQCLLTRDLERVLHSGEFENLPEGYAVEIGKYSFSIQILQTDLDNVKVYVDKAYFGDVELVSRIPGNDDYFIRHESRSYHVRLDQRAAQIILRLPDASGKINYHRAKLIPQGGKERVDPPGLLRAPFQGTFVKFLGTEKERLRKGSIVKKNQPLIILSAMKMETTLCSPVDGEISYLLEDGDIQRLQLGKTPDGQILGKKISEGEILFEIRTEEQGETVETPAGLRRTEHHEGQPSNGTFENIFTERFEQLVLSDPERHLPFLMTFLTAFIKGFHATEALAKQIIEILGKIPEDFWREKEHRIPEQIFSSLILHYCNVKYVFSSSENESGQIFQELTRFYSQWGNGGYHPPFDFKTAMDNLFRPYGITYWLPASPHENSRVEIAFLKILKSCDVCRDYPTVIRTLVKILGFAEKPSTRTIHSLRKLIMQEEAERDDSLAEFTSGVLAGWGILPWRQELGSTVSRQYADEFRRMIKDPLTAFAGFERSKILRGITESLHKPSLALIPNEISAWARDLLSLRQQKLAERFQIQRYFSPVTNVLFYGLQNLSDDNDTRYLSIALLDTIIPDRDSRGIITGIGNMERANIEAAQVFMAYQSVEKRQHNWIEIVAAGEITEIDFAGQNPKVFNQEIIRQVVTRVMPFYIDKSLDKSIVTLKYFSQNHPEAGIEHLLISPQNGRIELSFLSEQDPWYPYGNEATPAKDLQLYTKGKWPAEFWASRCFDSGSMTEIKIPSIDQVHKSGAPEFIPVGSRIYFGSISGQKACFYIKDSRINGGATGNLEGLKYVAACYIAFMSGAPVYVFNDGAGANIREGMVSLNRAGEGFMMNSLTNAETKPADFFAWIDSHPDTVLQELLHEIDNLFSFNRSLPSTGAFLVAVGIGSSTGLDVYGSSQAAIQVMIDNEHSYRVLTGSNVIKSVTGEDITNYNIGGARIMSMHTGTVDLVAGGNLHLLSIIRKIHAVFGREKPLDSIQRSAAESKSPKLICGINIAAQVDGADFWMFKEKYYASGSLIGGFARLGGRKVLVMGPRDDFGIRSFAAVTKASELLATARKTGSSQIIICGEKWYHELAREDSLVLRARLDFMQLLQQKSGIRIHIITHHRGLNHVPLNCNADALIAILTSDVAETTRQYVNQAATHVVHSAREAFDTALKIINLLKSAKTEANDNEGSPSVPENPALPFDMLTSVILPVFDKDSFVEYFRTMNDPVTGPCLITGLARLEGQTVGIIADQPAIMGGAPDAPGTEKFRIFTEFLNRNQIPVVMLSNAPGFVPGTKQERLRIQQIGARSLDVNILGKVPVVSVVINQNFGGRQIHAFSRYLRPGIVYIALRKAVLAVMGAQSSFDLFEGKKYAEMLSTDAPAAGEFRNAYFKKYNEKAAAEHDALNSGILDWVFEDVSTLREELIKGLKLARERNDRAFGEKA